MERIKIERNYYNGGYFADFTKNGKKYYASLANVLFGGTECMIFKYNKNGSINWAGVYCKRNIPVRKKELLNCIEDFLKGEEE